MSYEPALEELKMDIRETNISVFDMPLLPANEDSSITDTLVSYMALKYVIEKSDAKKINTIDDNDRKLFLDGHKKAIALAKQLLPEMANKHGISPSEIKVIPMDSGEASGVKNAITGDAFLAPLIVYDSKAVAKKAKTQLTLNSIATQVSNELRKTSKNFRLRSGNKGSNVYYQIEYHIPEKKYSGPKYGFGGI